MVIQKRSQRRAMVPWRPFRELEEMEQCFEDMFGRSFFPIWRRSPSIEGEEWMPAVDVFEKDDKFVVKTELPGMKQDDIDVSVSDNTLTVKGEKKSESETKEENYYYSGRSYGSFYRSIPLPSNVDADKIQADYEDGVLEVSIPKLAKSKPQEDKNGRKKEGLTPYHSGSAELFGGIVTGACV